MKPYIRLHCYYSFEKLKWQAEIKNLTWTPHWWSPVRSDISELLSYLSEIIQRHP